MNKTAKLGLAGVLVMIFAGSLLLLRYLEQDKYGAYHAGENGVSYPTCVYCPKPDYPDEARRSRYQGYVWLEVLVLKNGRPSPDNIEVTRGLGMGLDEKAIEAVRTWEFKPATGPNGRPVKAWTRVGVHFKLF